MFEKGLMEEFQYWLECREFTTEEREKIDNLHEEDKQKIVENVLLDEQLTQEMFNCFEWYLNKYLATKGDK